MRKNELNEEERVGLTEAEIILAEKYLKRHHLAGALKDADAMAVYELYMIGTSFKDIHLQFPHHPLAQIILTAAVRKWPLDRERMMSSLRDRVKAKVVKSVVDSVDLLTTMIAVTNTENLDAMRQYIMDPAKNPKPELRIRNIKEYKDILETLQKLVDGATNPKQKTSSMYGALEEASTVSFKKSLSKSEDDAPHELLASVLDDDEVDEDTDG